MNIDWKDLLTKCGIYLDPDYTHPPIESIVDSCTAHPKKDAPMTRPCTL